ncbi:MAG: beta-N-acetylhexosaminidase, partial [Limisphaerales bacterium]
MKPIQAVVLLTAVFLAAVPAFTAPSIIPLPVTMQTRPGVFTLGPIAANASGNSRATRKIFVDAASAQTGQYLAMMLSRSTGLQFSIVTNNAVGPVHNVILLTTVNALGTLGTEGYELTVAPDSVVIRAPQQAGVFYGVQSLLQLFPTQILSPQPVAGVAWTAPCVYIQDYPRFAYRGMMLDVARHFVDKQEIEKILDGLALHKINQFHWHLNDDHGWRLEIKSYPLLTGDGMTTNTGAFRTGIDYGLPPLSSTAWNSAGRYGGYYTQEDVKEVVAYATQRHINIVPEIEIPAHCSAALWSYAAWGCGNAASAYNMDSISYSKTLFSIANCWPTVFTNILNEVCNLFPSQYIHCGGDEVTATGDTQWTTYSPDATLMASLGISTGGGTTSIRAYQRYLTTNLVAFLQTKGRTFAGWSEIEDSQIISGALLYEWETDKAAAAAAAGNPVVMCPNGINYYEVSSTQTNPYATNVEPYFIVGGSPAYKTVSTVYNYDPVASSAATGTATNNIIGGQLNLWTENVPGPMNVEYKIFPRMCAQAEATWTPLAQKSLSSFTTRLVSDEQRLAQMGLNYNKENITLIGTWGPSLSLSGQSATYNITSYVTKAGELDFSFVYQSGGNAANVSNFQLLENGVAIDTTDTHVGRAGANFPNGFTQAS